MKNLCGVAILLASFGAYSAECDDPKTSLEISLCLGKELRDSDVKINQSYKELMGRLTGRDKATLRNQQRAWIKERDTVCDLDTKETNREKWFQELLLDYGKTICVTRYTRKRTGELDRMLSNSSMQPGMISEPPKADASPANNLDVAYDRRPATVHMNGKWYYEMLIDYSQVAQIGPVALVIGVSESGHLVGSMDNIRKQDAGKDPITVGIAVDLDNGKLYISRNGAWIGGAPGSNEGLDLKLGRNYYGTFAISADSPKTYLDNKALIPNFGDRQMTYAIPAGYKSWRNVVPNMSAMPNVNVMPNEMPDLAKRNNCSACHAINIKVVGPAWMDVSKKYKFAKQFEYQGQMYPLEEGLMMKISKGGSGHWGSMPMPANDINGSKQGDIKALVSFILALAK